MTQSLRVAMIGAGYFSQFHLQGWREVHSAQLVAVCDTDSQRALSAATQCGLSDADIFTDPEVMLDSVAPDLLDIVTPPQTHLPLVQLAAERQIRTICQKPLAPTYAQAQQLVQTMRAADTMLVVHENFRFSPWYREARRLIDDGTLGELHSVAFRLRPGDGQGKDAYLARQPYFQQMERFLVHETAIHFIDTFRYLMGEVQAVTAILRRMNPVIAGEDAGYLVFEFAGGSTGLFDGNRLNEHNAQDMRRVMGEMWLEGSRGVLRLDGDGQLYVKPHGAAEQVHPYDRGPDTFAGGACTRVQQHVVDHVLEQMPLENTGEQYLRNMLIAEAIYESDATGRRVELPPD